MLSSPATKILIPVREPLHNCRGSELVARVQKRRSIRDRIRAATVMERFAHRLRNHWDRPLGIKIFAAGEEIRRGWDTWKVGPPILAASRQSCRLLLRAEREPARERACRHDCRPHTRHETSTKQHSPNQIESKTWGRHPGGEPASWLASPTREKESPLGRGLPAGCRPHASEPSRCFRYQPIGPLHDCRGSDSVADRAPVRLF